MRRSLLAAALSLASLATVAADLPTVEMWKSPACGCCGRWAEQMRAAGFEVRIHAVADVPAARAATGMPDRFGACHSAKAGGYAVEGHVPPADVKHLLAEGPAAVGIAVPSMPPGSPGMEGPRAVRYDSLLIRSGGEAQVFARH